MNKPNQKFLAALFGYCLAVKILPYVLGYFGVEPRAEAIYPWSFTPFFAVGIFGVAMFRDLRVSFGLPLLAWLLADVLIGIEAGMRSGWRDGLAHSVYPDQVFGYCGLIVACGCGFLVRGRRNWGTVAAAAVIGPTLFFLVSNFGTWWLAADLGYSRDWTGLADCYVKGIPFFRPQLVSTLCYSILLFSPLGLGQLKSPSESAEQPAVGAAAE